MWAEDYVSKCFEQNDFCSRLGLVFLLFKNTNDFDT